MPIDKTTLQSAILQLLGNRSITRVNSCLLGGNDEFRIALKKKFPNEQISVHQIMSRVWSMISQGLIYIDYSGSQPEYWALYLTEEGFEAVEGDITPNNPSEYIKQLKTQVPIASEIVLNYANEASITFTSRCYLASAVMLGVASEAAFLELADSFGKWLLPGTNRDNFIKIMEGKSMFVHKFKDFRKKLEPMTSRIPEELTDNIDSTLNSVIEFLRVNRNDAGHPTGKNITREIVYMHLVSFVYHLKRLYALKSYFDSQKSTP
ncbi:MAG: hypothetical protein AB9903_12520 [Vulcanimicrobiota bacterium]